MPVRVVKQWNVEDTEPPVTISRDGQIALVATGMNNSIDCIGVPLGKKVQRLDGHSSSVKALTITPDRRHGASGSDDGEIRLWDLATGNHVSTLRGHTRRVTSVEFSSDGKLLLSGSWDNTCRLWDVGTSQCASVLTGHSDGVTSVAIAPDDKIAASSSFDCGVRVWNLASGECLEERPGHESKVMCLSISRTGNQLVAGDVRGYLSVSDLPPTALRVVGPFARSIGSARLSADGARAYLGLEGGGFWSFDLETQDATQLFELTGRFPEHLPLGLHFAISDDGRYVVAARAASAAIIELERPPSRFRFFGRRSS
jgi:hypothetical protein